VLSVSGVADHLGHGPGHHLIDAHPPIATDSVAETKPTATQKSGPDVVETPVTPTAAASTTSQEKPSSTPPPAPPPEASETDFTSRNLNEEERNGLWALMGLFGAVWILGSFVHRRRPSEAKEHH
jgi:hypothetical protein